MFKELTDTNNNGKEESKETRNEVRGKCTEQASLTRV